MTMDITEQASSLYEQGYSQREIAAKLNLSHKKVLQMLVTSGMIETDESRMYAQGYTVEQIAETLGKQVKSVLGRIPYQKGIYNAENPTINALRIRKHREKTSGK